MLLNDDKYYFDLAIREARKALNTNNVPVGCVIVFKNKIIAKAYNKKNNKNISIYHAEILAIIKACKYLKTFILEECTMYVTLEPCMMWMGAIIESRIKKVYFGAKNNSEQMYDFDKISKYVDIYNLNDSESSKILSDFFKNKRKN